MKPVAPVLGAALALAACASGYGYGGPPGPGPLAFDAYYDGAYGPLEDGYWGSDGGFFYRNGADHRWTRDTGGHFSHEARGGFNGMQFHGGHPDGMPAGGGFRGGGHGGGHGPG